MRTLQQWMEAAPAWIRRPARKVYYRRRLKAFTEMSWDSARWIKPLIHAGDRVADVGANIGYVTLLFSSWVGPEGRVFSFEPVADTFETLRDTVHTRRCANVEVFDVAASDHAGSAGMAVPEYASGGRNYYESFIVEGRVDEVSSGVQVKTATLDSILLDRAPSIQFLKVDVEGHEWKALQGAMGIIRRDHPALFVEIMSDPGTAGTDAARLFEWLQGEGYQIYASTDQGFVPWPEIKQSVDWLFWPTARGSLPGLIIRDQKQSGS